MLFSTTYHKLYLHTKTRTIYDILHTAKHTETDEPLVIYRRLKLTENTPNQIWARPLSMFMGDVNIDGQLKPRFEKLDEEFDKIKCNICLVNELKKYCENNNIVFE